MQVPDQRCIKDLNDPRILSILHTSSWKCIPALLVLFLMTMTRHDQIWWWFIPNSKKKLLYPHKYYLYDIGIPVGCKQQSSIASKLGGKIIILAPDILEISKISGKVGHYYYSQVEIRIEWVSHDILLACCCSLKFRRALVHSRINQTTNESRPRITDR